MHQKVQFDNPKKRWKNEHANSAARTWKSQWEVAHYSRDFAHSSCNEQGFGGTLIEFTFCLCIAQRIVVLLFIFPFKTLQFRL